MPDLAHEGTKKSGDEPFSWLSGWGKRRTLLHYLAAMMALSPGVGATHTTPHGGGQLLPMSEEPQVEGLSNWNGCN